MKKRTVTAYGTLHRSEYGGERITGNGAQLWAWAHRAGSAWPGSSLCDARSVSATFGRNGDLEDIHHPGTPDLDAVEFSAWADDVRALAEQPV